MPEDLIAQIEHHQLPGRPDEIFLNVAGHPFKGGKADNDQWHHGQQVGATFNDDPVNKRLDQFGRSGICSRDTD